MELVREWVARFNREGFLPEELFDPDVELFNIREFPLPGPYSGYEGLRKWREAIFEVVEEGRFEIDELIDVDEADLVVSKMRILGRAKHTGIHVDIGFANVNWIRNGRICRAESFTDHADALKAAGLSE